MGGLPPGLSHAMDQMKGMGVAPHLNPAFLQEMAAQGNAGAKGVQNMVRNVQCCVHVHVYTYYWLLNRYTSSFIRLHVTQNYSTILTFLVKVIIRY